MTSVLEESGLARAWEDNSISRQSTRSAAIRDAAERMTVGLDDFRFSPVQPVL